MSAGDEFQIACIFYQSLIIPKGLSFYIPYERNTHDAYFSWRSLYAVENQQDNNSNFDGMWLSYYGSAEMFGGDDY